MGPIDAPTKNALVDAIERNESRYSDTGLIANSGRMSSRMMQSAEQAIIAEQVKPAQPESPAVRRGHSHKYLRSVVITVIYRKRRTTRRWTAPSGRAFNEAGVAQILDQVAQGLERTFPDDNLRLVDLGDGRFNIIHPSAEKGSDVKVTRTSNPPELGSEPQGLSDGDATA